MIHSSAHLQFLPSHRSPRSKTLFNQVLSQSRANLLCFVFRENPQAVLIQHSLYVSVVEKSHPPPLTGEQYGKMEPKYLRVVTARVFYVLREFLTSPFIFNNSVETAAPFLRRQPPTRKCYLHNLYIMGFIMFLKCFIENVICITYMKCYLHNL